MSSPLEMIMGQDRTANDRQVRIRADEIMREQRREIKETLKRIAGQLHRHVIVVEYDAMFVVIHIRRVLEKPRLLV
ncbi:hypothetical protein D3C81_1271600 [compost metagenome]